VTVLNKKQQEEIDRLISSCCIGLAPSEIKIEIFLTREEIREQIKRWFPEPN